MSVFKFKEEDPEGLLTLEAIRNAIHFNKWMYEQVSVWMKNDILEVGSGIGNLSEFFIEKGASISLSDIRKSYCNVLEKRFPDHIKKNPVRNVDLVAEDFSSKYADLIGTFDSAFALNVVEHIENDKLALKNLYSLLKSNGNLVILVPAHPALYNKIDKSLHHYKRYTKSGIEKVILDAGFKVTQTKGFNALGIPAWWISGTLFRSTQIRHSEMYLYDKMVPLAQLIDWLLGKSIGLSLITFAQKP